jgi:GcrA cell cycle regulator
VWPTGDPKTTDFSFCSEPIEPGKPYCYEHCVLAYTNTRESN